MTRLEEKQVEERQLLVELLATVPPAELNTFLTDSEAYERTDKLRGLQRQFYKLPAGGVNKKCLL